MFKTAAYTCAYMDIADTAQMAYRPGLGVVANTAAISYNNHGQPTDISAVGQGRLLCMPKLNTVKS